MENLLLNKDELPHFDKITSKDFKPALEGLISSYKACIKDVLQEKEIHWEKTLQILDEEYAPLDFAWNVINHLNSVQNTEDVRKAYEEVLPLMTDFGTEISQNNDLYKLYVKLSKAGSYDFYSIAQKKSIANSIRDFTLAGVGLPKDRKDRLKQINQKISSLSNQFEKNILDSTIAFKYHTEDNNIVENLPPHTIDFAKEKAKEMGKKGYVFTLDAPCYIAIMSYAKDRKIREEFYKAYISRASEIANKGKFDNSSNISEILALRQEKSEILGFSNYAELSLARKMASNNEEVMTFLQDLLDKSKPQADKEKAELEKFAKAEDNIDALEPWDAAYYSTLFQKKNFDFSEEVLRPYFPEDRVLQGLFNLAEKVFNITISEVKDVSVWHETVKLFEVKDENGKLRGKFYTDLYARDFKRSGAWMADLRSRMSYSNGSIMHPIAFLEGNFAPPTGGKPALLSHNEVNTLFHEFGHTMQHVLTIINYPSVSGIAGVPWDAVELPSQFMENYCWEWDVLEDLSGHFETGKKLPRAEFDKLIEVKNYNSAMAMVRQLEFAMFDFRIHAREGSDADSSVTEILADVRSKAAVMAPKDYNYFENSFSHIFAGGYAAGYYSYKWAEVLSADAFSKFEEEGVFDKRAGMKFRETVLEQGGAKDAMDIFVDFRGREPQIDALLRHNGIEG